VPSEPGVHSTPTYVAVVDDDEELCRSLVRLLRAAGFHAITYASAEAFLADAKHPAFDCLVFDIELGGMTGIDLAKRLAADRCPTPFIYLTAHDESVARAREEAPEAAAYFRKTDPGADVLDAIRRCVDLTGRK
jgi:FixJ family two-component response regulator